MPTASFNKFQDFVEQLGKGVHQLHAAGHTLKAYLTNEVPLATDTVKADIADITNEHNYAPADVQNDFTEAAGVGTLTGVDITWEAVGGTFGPFRYVVIYNDSVDGDPLVAWWDYGHEATVYAGEQFVLNFGDSIFTIT